MVHLRIVWQHPTRRRYPDRLDLCCISDASGMGIPEANWHRHFLMPMHQRFMSSKLDHYTLVRVGFNPHPIRDASTLSQATVFKVFGQLSPRA
ncbi:MAG: hypothetical protein ACE5KJ_03765 [Candidatus Zixiibacteriota bacterium]